MVAEKAAAADHGDQLSVQRMSFRHCRPCRDGAPPCRNPLPAATIVDKRAPPSYRPAPTRQPPETDGRHRAQMAELVDAPSSGGGARKGVEVRVLFWAPSTSC